MVRITTRHRIAALILSIFLALILIECSLRIGGFVFLSLQRSGNEITGRAVNEGIVVYRILCLGESTTANIFKNSWPSQLEPILNNRSSHVKFEVFNEGIGGTNTALILARLRNNLDKYDPDMVITMMGTNDAPYTPLYGENLREKIFMSLKSMRVYEISEAFWTVFKARLNSVDSIETEQHIEEPAKPYPQLIKDYESQGKFVDAVGVINKIIELNPNDSRAYYELGMVYHLQGRLEDSVKIYKKAIELEPNGAGAYFELASIYHQQGKLEDAAVAFKKVIELTPNLDHAYRNLAIVYHEQGVSDEEVEKFYKEKGFSFRSVNISSSDATRYHYNYLYRILKERGIKYVAMQYPTRSIDELKDMLGNSEEIIFVSNEENFKEALQIGEYADYFTDKAGITFGHATLEGNRMIAENVANVILEELNITD